MNSVKTSTTTKNTSTKTVSQTSVKKSATQSAKSTKKAAAPTQPTNPKPKLAASATAKVKKTAESNEPFHVSSILMTVKPKRVKTAYRCFVKNRFAKMSDEEKSAGIKAIKQIGEEWKKLSDEAKKQFQAEINLD